jgi:hypothetical protein
MSSETYNLDDEWINNFEKTDNLYKEFYKENLYYINLRVFYINKNTVIEKFITETFFMSKPNYVMREELLGMLKKYSINDGNRYSLLSILKYNILLDNNEIKQFLTNNSTENYLTVVKNIDTITFEKTINMFHDLNDLIFLFYEQQKEIKKINPQNLSKKIYLNYYNPSSKKTLKKR